MQQNIFILKPDKGNGVVVLDQNDYDQGILKIINDSGQLRNIPTEHCATDTFTFVQDIQSLSMFGKFMVSFDVESLFTNIPLEECIDLAVNYISEGNPDLKISKPELRSIFTVATAQTHFLFNGSFYDQIEGVAMGSPLAPVLANLFIGHHEKL